MEKYYYHGTDIFVLPQILEKGLQCGYDGVIWLYSKYELTSQVIAMLRAKKNLSKEVANNIGWTRKTPLRNYFDLGFGVVSVKAEYLTGTIVHFTDIKDVRYSFLNKYLFGIRQKSIPLEAINYLGKYNEYTDCLEKENLETYKKLYHTHIRPFEEMIRKSGGLW